MNVTIEKLSKDIIKHILADIGALEADGVVKFSLSKAEKWKLANEWLDQTKITLTDALVKDQAFSAAFDGGATPNPGEMKIGGWIRDPNGKRIYSYTESIGHGTNNEAEYNSLLKLMEEIKKRGIINIHIQGDSALVVNQVNGLWKCKDPRMKQLRSQVCSTAEGIKYHLEHVLRDKNSEADALT